MGAIDQGRASPEPTAAGLHLLARGVAASPGLARGVVALTVVDAVQRAAAGHDVVLVCQALREEDASVVALFAALVTLSGGLTSDAAIAARVFGKACVVGCEALHIDVEQQLLRRRTSFLQSSDDLLEARTLGAGDLLTVDGSAGRIYC